MIHGIETDSYMDLQFSAKQTKRVILELERAGQQEYREVSFDMMAVSVVL